jgi:hypothetical protein
LTEIIFSLLPRPGNDTVTGTGGADVITGFTGDDAIRAGGGDDLIFEGVLTWIGAPEFLPGATEPYLATGKTYDTGLGNDRISGGEGFDGLSYGGSLRAARVDLARGIVQRGAERDRFDGIEALVLGDAGDRVIAGTALVALDMAGGDDRLSGVAAGLVAAGGAGFDTVDLSALNRPVLARLGDGGRVTIEGLAADLTGFEALAGARDHISVLVGNDGANRLTGGRRGDDLRGEAGDDTLQGGRGDDTLQGGEGRDALAGGAGADLVLTGDDHDRASGNGGADTLFGADGRDTLDGGAGRDSLSGGTGGDVLSGGAGADTILGDVGNDSLSGGAGRDRIEGGDNNDTIDGGAGDDRIDGGDGIDTVAGGDGDDILRIGDGRAEGDGGNDRIHVAGGSAYGGDGNDRLLLDIATGGFGSGGAGDDVIVVSGNGAPDLVPLAVWGGAGEDVLVFSGRELVLRKFVLFGGAPATIAGDDIETIRFGGQEVALTIERGVSARDLALSSGDSTARLDGNGSRITFGEGRNVADIRGIGNAVTMGGGDDIVSIAFDAARTRVDAGDGDDSVTVRDLSARVFGGAGADTIVIWDSDGPTTGLVDAGDGNDRVDLQGAFRELRLGAGDDRIDFGPGISSALVDGGSGADLFVFDTGIAAGNVTLAGFDTAEDRIARAGVSGLADAASARQDGADAVLFFRAGDDGARGLTLRLTGVDLGDLADAVFVPPPF